jgi:HPt (histidine-containing phosphotransfer) domain-containing protein
MLLQVLGGIVHRESSMFRKEDSTMTRSNKRLDSGEGVRLREEALLELIPGYLSRRRIDLEHMRNWLFLSNYDAIAEMAHRIKGNGSSYGFDELSRCASRLQAAAEAEDEAGVAQIIHSLETILKDLERS